MAVNIEFEDGFYLKSDDANWIVGRLKTYQSGKHKGEQYSDTPRYYNTLTGALQALLNFRLLDSDAMSLNMLQANLRRFRDEIQLALTTEWEGAA